nr:immunoglobulin light chain junction region [Macaca mulatta]
DYYCLIWHNDAWVF